MVKKEVVAVIPARGGSKRMPNKNITDFFGKPMIAWTIEAVQKSNIFDRIIVSTDDPEIANVAENFGVGVPFLRTKYADDFSTTTDATIFALQQTKDYYNETYEFVAQLMANCPLRTDQEITVAYNHFREHEYDFQISCFKFGWMNPWWAVELDKNFVPKPLFDSVAGKRSQDLPKLYCPTGAVWFARCDKLKEAGTFYGKGYRMFPMDWKVAVDIDNYDDLEMAKLLYSMNVGSKTNASCNKG